MVVFHTVNGFKHDEILKIGPDVHQKETELAPFYEVILILWTFTVGLGSLEGPNLDLLGLVDNFHSFSHFEKSGIGLC